MWKKRRDKTSEDNVFKRFFRAIFAIVILSALLLGITFAIKTLSNFNSQKAANLYRPVLSKLGVSNEEVSKVAGAFVKRMSNAGSMVRESTKSTTENINTSSTRESYDKTLSFSLALMSDSESDFGILAHALAIAKSKGADAVMFLGDFTDWGDLAGLKKSKQILDDSNLTYYVIPGDHDLASSVADGDLSGLRNFMQVFSKNYYDFTYKGVTMIVMDNSANYSVISNDIVLKFQKDVKSADFVFLSQPLYHPTIPRTMGVIDGDVIKTVKDQSDLILSYIRDSNVKAVFAADQHFYSESKDPKKPGLAHFVIGALTDDPNVQTPQFAIFNLYDDGSYGVTQVEL